MVRRRQGRRRESRPDRGAVDAAAGLDGHLSGEDQAETHANPSKPSSRTEKDETAPAHTGPHTQGRAQDPSRSAHTRTVETITVSKVGFCETCSEDLRAVRPRGHERRTPIDIVFAKVVTQSTPRSNPARTARARAAGRFPRRWPGPCRTARASGPTYSTFSSPR